MRPWPCTKTVATELFSPFFWSEYFQCLLTYNVRIVNAKPYAEALMDFTHPRFSPQLGHEINPHYHFSFSNSGEYANSLKTIIWHMLHSIGTPLLMVDLPPAWVLKSIYIGLNHMIIWSMHTYICSYATELKIETPPPLSIHKREKRKKTK